MTPVGGLTDDIMICLPNDEILGVMSPSKMHGNLAMGLPILFVGPKGCNVDEAVQQGVEADFRMMVTESWMVYAGFTYTNVEFTDGEVP